MSAQKISAVDVEDATMLSVLNANVSLAEVKSDPPYYYNIKRMDRKGNYSIIEKHAQLVKSLFVATKGFLLRQTQFAKQFDLFCKAHNLQKPFTVIESITYNLRLMMAHMRLVKVGRFSLPVTATHCSEILPTIEKHMPSATEEQFCDSEQTPKKALVFFASLGINAPRHPQFVFVFRSSMLLQPYRRYSYAISSRWAFCRSPLIGPQPLEQASKLRK